MPLLVSLEGAPAPLLGVAATALVVALPPFVTPLVVMVAPFVAMVAPVVMVLTPVVAPAMFVAVQPTLRVPTVAVVIGQIDFVGSRPEVGSFAP